MEKRETSQSLIRQLFIEFFLLIFLLFALQNQHNSNKVLVIDFFSLFIFFSCFINNVNHL